MTKPSTRDERRGPDRPAVGDWKACPKCAAGMLLFTEHYRGKYPPAPSVAPMPAWVCDQCPGVLFVRAEHQPVAVRAAAQRLRARANRSLMKSRAARSRAGKLLKRKAKLRD
jgi:hypothetical protein